MKKEVAIVFGITKDFSFALANVLIGMKKHCKFFWEDIIVYHDGISKSEQECLNSILPCEFILFDESMFNDEAIHAEGLKNYSLLTLARFECFGLLEQYRKIIWHDVDILIQKDFSDLLKYGDKTGYAATQSLTFRMEQNFYGLMPGYNMLSLLYNAGILVLSDRLNDPAGLRIYCYNTFNKYADKLRYNDQSVLNMMLQDYRIEVEKLDLDVYCCHPEMQECDEAVIVHAYGSNKFWNSDKLKKQFPEWKRNHEQWIRIRGGHEVPRVSVVMSVYERTDFLKDAVESILRQTLVDLELIVVIEKSDRQEEVRQALEEFHDDRIVIICNDKNLGFAESLNVGFDVARGKYIARMDDDDISLPERLEKEALYLDKHSEVAVVGTWMKMFGRSTEECVSPEAHEELMVRAIKENPMFHPTVMLRKKDILEYGFRYDPAYLAEDYDMWCRMMNVVRFANIPEILYHFRASGQNATVTKQQKVLECHLHIMQRTLKEKLQLDFSEDEMLILRFPHIINECYNSDEVYKLRTSVIKQIFEANRKLHSYNEELLVKYLGDFRPDLKAETKSKLKNHPTLYKYARAMYKFATGARDENGEKKREKENEMSILRKGKMRLLPPSSRSFHDHIGLLEGRVSNVLDKLDSIIVGDCDIKPGIKSGGESVLQLEDRINNLERILNNVLEQQSRVNQSSKIWLEEIGNQISRIDEASQAALTAVYCGKDQRLSRVLERILSVSLTNQQAFSGYKNKYAGRVFVICGAGPTLRHYKPIEGAIHIALNRAFLFEPVKFDYFFSCDFRAIAHVQDELKQYKGNNCIKFFGTQNDNLIDEIPESYRIACNAVRFDTDSHFLSGRFALDITSRSVGNFNTIAFPALQFALFTNPAKIYIVGCDTAANGHFSIKNLRSDQLEQQNNEQRTLMRDNFSIIYEQWSEFKKFATMYYPDTELISINPIGLKGLFEDEYTESFLLENSFGTENGMKNEELRGGMES